MDFYFMFRFCRILHFHFTKLVQVTTNSVLLYHIVSEEGNREIIQISSILIWLQFAQNIPLQK